LGAGIEVGEEFILKFLDEDWKHVDRDFGLLIIVGMELLVFLDFLPSSGGIVQVEHFLDEIEKRRDDGR
jgi:hypothetical protein